MFTSFISASFLIFFTATGEHILISNDSLPYTDWSVSNGPLLESFVEFQVKQHVRKAIENLLSDRDLHSSYVKQIVDENAKVRVEPEKKRFNAQEADIDVMNRTFVDIFSRPRSDSRSVLLKQKSRENIISKFKQFGLKVTTHNFKFRKNGFLRSGVNIIAVKDGLNRNKSSEEILLFGAHYDTVSSSPGINDNGSGMVAILELIRLLQSHTLNQTLMFVAFDLEELGLLGSIAFVRQYLIPKELIRNGARFLGAYILDMLLTFDTSDNSQKLPSDIARAIPGLRSKLKTDNYKGNFIAIWSRRNVDSSLWNPLLNAWSQSPNSAKFKLLQFDCPLPAINPTTHELSEYGTFTRSDHASFWFHKVSSYPSTLKAVLLTDMGPWRGKHRSCYHNWCDDKRQLTINNLQFLKHTVDTLFLVITENPPKFSSNYYVSKKKPFSFADILKLFEKNSKTK